MFDAWGPWAWVAFAWAQLLVTYGGYTLYLRGRMKRAAQTKWIGETK